MHHFSICLAERHGGRQRSSSGKCRSCRRLLRRESWRWPMPPSDSSEEDMPMFLPRASSSVLVATISPSETEASVVVWLVSASSLAPVSSLLFASMSSMQSSVAPDLVGAADSCVLPSPLTVGGGGGPALALGFPALSFRLHILGGFSNLQMRALGPPEHTRMYWRKEKMTTVSKSIRTTSKTCVRDCRRTSRDAELVTL
mmetsp:Transcript_11918/g.32632  ORF Transcript_11918/g.32632 Transcript_11918/m.32632 type:complete len:200 (+) Transcript_11918:708-1307(+)